MKPFNLEAAKAGKPIVTRDGRVAKFVAHLPEADVRPVVILLGSGVFTARADGSQSYGNKSPGDLFMAEEEITVYFNQYGPESFGGVFTSRAEAEAAAVSSPEPQKLHEVTIKV